jgi:hypothetical protein
MEAALVGWVDVIISTGQILKLIGVMGVMEMPVRKRFIPATGIEGFYIFGEGSRN